ncbi:MAG: carbohydrate-binding protein [Planctomycetota bacterium]|nr:carbohydrate-binding protein [Planctomycetota bacterium]
MRAINMWFLVMAMAAGASAREYHVSVKGNDQNEGSASKPYRTISAAAQIAQPGDIITVHGGIYRERVTLPRGGESDAKRIVYRAADGQKVVIKGSEVIKGWQKLENDTWKVTIANSFFGNFNPYSDLIVGDWFSPMGREHHTGAVYLNDHWLIEAAKLEDVLKPIGQASGAYAASRDQYLLNVAWLCAGEDSGDNGRIPAAGFAAQHGIQTADCSEGGKCIGWIERGDWVQYDRIDFGTRCEQMEFRAASPTGGGTIELRLGKPDGELIGTCTVKDTGDWQSWSSFKAKIKPVSGVKTLCLVFQSLKSKAEPDNQLWFAQVDQSNTTIWAQFRDVNPNDGQVEINVRRTVFYPDKTGINYLTVRGFTMMHAATPWSPPTAEQIGLIGTNWSKGWIIENNDIRYSVCTGITLGKHGDEFDNTSADTAEGYVKTIERALTRGWSKDNIGHHIVRNNRISHCEQAGIVGSMGAVFCTVTGNTIHDIHVRRLFTGAEMAGIKFHGAIDTVISHNHIYRTCRGIWLDWMTQGTRVTGNLLHDNGPSEDLFVEVNHGPFLVDNNIFLSRIGVVVDSQGGAYVHNLIAGNVHVAHNEDRQTPYHKAHSTEVVGLAPNPSGDDRYYNNIFVNVGLTAYDPAKLPVFMAGNLFLNGAKPSKHEPNPLVQPNVNPGLKLVEKDDGVYLQLTMQAYKTLTTKLVTTELLGRAVTPNMAFENPDGSPLKVDTDYFGNKRNASNPSVGPFESTKVGDIVLKVW